MRHLESERWSRGDSVLHRLDPRCKLLAALLVLGFIGTASPWEARHVAGYGILAAVTIAASRLPLVGLARRVAVILPFTLSFALAAWISTGDPARAAALLSRSSISAVFVIVLSGVTSMPALLEAAGRFGAPKMLVTVSQFLYRYLFVLIDQATRLRQAALCRGGFRWDASAGAAAALFASSEERATRIHRAMLARGFDGAFSTLNALTWRWQDTVSLVIGLSVLAFGRMKWGL